jgi:hypothetical protein
MVPSFIFMGFEKFHIFAQNPWVLANGFTENCQFEAKTDRNSVFLGHDTHIVNRLSITVPYFIFHGFWKISHFCSKSVGVSLRVYRKLPVWGKNWPNLRISWSWPPYYKLVIYNGPVIHFYGFWKISHFCQKSMGVGLRVYRKLPVWGKNWPKLHISWSWPPYYKSVIYNGPVIHFLWVLKNFTFLPEIHGC